MWERIGDRSSRGEANTAPQSVKRPVERVPTLLVTMRWRRSTPVWCFHRIRRIAFLSILARAAAVRRRQRGGRNVVQLSSTVSEMEALPERIRSQSKAVAEHIAADAEAQAFLDDSATPDPLSH